MKQFLIFQKLERKKLFILQKTFLYFLKISKSPKNIFYISGKRTFFYFGKGIFRTRFIFSTLVYLDAYSENYQISSMEGFEKKSNTLKTFLILQEMELSSSKLKKHFIFQERTNNVPKARKILPRRNFLSPYRSKTLGNFQ